MNNIEAMKLALDAFGEIAWSNETQWQRDRAKQAITALRQAIEQAQQAEPVAWVSTDELLVMKGNALAGAKDWRINVGLVKQDGDVGLYISPSPRQPLTDEQIIELANSQGWNVQIADLPANLLRMRVRDLGRAIEAAHGIKGEA